MFQKNDVQPQDTTIDLLLISGSYQSGVICKEKKYQCLGYIIACCVYLSVCVRVCAYTFLQ